MQNHAMACEFSKYTLQVQRCHGYAIGECYALPVEVGEGCSLLGECHHGRIVHPENSGMDGARERKEGLSERRKEGAGRGEQPSE